MGHSGSKHLSIDPNIMNQIRIINNDLNHSITFRRYWKNGKNEFNKVPIDRTVKNIENSIIPTTSKKDVDVDRIDRYDRSRHYI